LSGKRFDFLYHVFVAERGERSVSPEWV